MMITASHSLSTSSIESFIATPRSTSRGSQRLMYDSIDEVLDIGGVFMQLGGMNTLLKWTGLGPSQLKSAWLASPAASGMTGQAISHCGGTVMW